MGFIVNENIELNNGIEILGLYFCIAYNMIYVQKYNNPLSGQIVYRYHCSFQIYKDKLSKDAGKQYIQEEYHEVTLNDQSGDVYQVMYDSKKSMYQNTLDC